jgi:hypothetical protein
VPEVLRERMAMGDLWARMTFEAARVRVSKRRTSPVVEAGRGEEVEALCSAEG